MMAQCETQNMIDLAYQLVFFSRDGPSDWSEVPGVWSYDEQLTACEMADLDLVEAEPDRIRLTVRGLGWLLEHFKHR